MQLYDKNVSISWVLKTMTTLILFLADLKKNQCGKLLMSQQGTIKIHNI